MQQLVSYGGWMFEPRSRNDLRVKNSKISADRWRDDMENVEESN